MKCANEKCHRRFFAEDCVPHIHGVLDVTIQDEDKTLKWDIQKILNLAQPTMATEQIETNLLLLRKKDFEVELLPKNNSILEITVLDKQIDDDTLAQQIDNSRVVNKENVHIHNSGVYDISSLCLNWASKGF